MQGSSDTTMIPSINRLKAELPLDAAQANVGCALRTDSGNWANGAWNAPYEFKCVAWMERSGIRG